MTPQGGEGADAGTLPMRLEFTYTAGDLVEAQVAAAYGPTGATGVGRGIRLAAVLAVIAAALAVLVYAQLQPVPRRPGPLPPSKLLPAVLPWLVFFGVIVYYVGGPLFRQMRGRRARSFLYPPGDEPPDAGTSGLAPPRPWPLYAVLASVAISLLVGAYVGWRSRVNAGQPGLSPDLFRSLFPVVMLAVIATIFARGSGRRAAESALQESPDLQLPQAVEVSEQAFAISNSVTRAEHRWEAFDRVVETPNLFLLYHTPATYVVVPKRAFESPQAVGHFRDLLRRRIVDRPGSAFPVLPARPGA